MFGQDILMAANMVKNLEVYTMYHTHVFLSMCMCDWLVTGCIQGHYSHCMPLLSLLFHFCAGRKIAISECHYSSPA